MFSFSSPSTEWQDDVVSTLSHALPSLRSSRQSSSRETNPETDRPKRQRRGDADRDISPSAASSTRSPVFSVSSSASPVLSRTGEGPGSGGDTDGEEDVAEALGQLSVNEDQQIRFHGKASGLHLLGINTKAEARNEGGIWSVRPHGHVP